MLSIENLDLFYGDAQALAGVSLEVPRGDIVAIVGANGAGKTSLIRAIAGMSAIGAFLKYRRMRQNWAVRDALGPYGRKTRCGGEAKAPKSEAGAQLRCRAER